MVPECPEAYMGQEIEDNYYILINYFLGHLLRKHAVLPSKDTKKKKKGNGDYINKVTKKEQ